MRPQPLATLYLGVMTRDSAEPAPLTAAEIEREKIRLGIPASGQPLRAWIRYQLQQRKNPKTGRPYTQADIARETFTSEGNLSYIYTGERVNGRKAERVRRVTADVLEIPEAVLFPASAQAGGDRQQEGNDNDGSG